MMGRRGYARLVTATKFVYATSMSLQAMSAPYDMADYPERTICIGSEHRFFINDDCALRIGFTSTSYRWLRVDFHEEL